MFGWIEKQVSDLGKGIEHNVQQIGKGAETAVQEATKVGVNIYKGSESLIHGTAEYGKGLIGGDTDLMNKSFSRMAGGMGNVLSFGTASWAAGNDGVNHILRDKSVNQFSLGLSGDVANTNRGITTGTYLGHISNEDWWAAARAGSKIGAAAVIGGAGYELATDSFSRQVVGQEIGKIGAAAGSRAVSFGGATLATAGTAYAASRIKGNDDNTAKADALKSVGLAPPGSVPSQSNSSDPKEFDPSWSNPPSANSGGSISNQNLMFMGGFALVAVLIIASQKR